MFERRLYHHIDWLLIAARARHLRRRPGDDLQHDRRREPHLLDAGLRAWPRPRSRWSSASRIDYRSLADKSHWLYLAMMILLVSVLFIGSVRGGSRRWIDLGTLQPAAVGIRQGDAGADARQDARRRAAARAHQHRSVHRRRR